MAAKIVIEGSDNVLASQLKDFFRQIEEGGIKGHHIQAMLERRNPFETLPFKLLGKYKLGTYKNADALKQAMEKAGMKMSDWAKDIMGKPAFKVADKEEEVILVEITVAELGFKDGVMYSVICKKAVGTEVSFEGQDYIVELCPNEVGPQLRLQHLKQKKGEWLRIAMEAITVSGGHQFIFVVVHDSGDMCLGSIHGHAGYVYDSGNRFVFCLRKKT